MLPVSASHFMSILTLSLLLALCGGQVEESQDDIDRVVDGDTVMLAHWGRARLIGIDTPESVKPGHPVENFGKEASDFARELLEGRRVTVSFGPQLRDQHGRVLVYLLLEDGTFVNLHLVELGLAFAYQANHPRLEEFLKAEAQARKGGIGIWGTPIGESGLHGNTSSAVYHTPNCVNFRCSNCQAEFGSIPEAEAAGYRPHRACVQEYLRGLPH